MLKHVFLASAALALLAAPSFAAPVSTSVTINGSVAAKCSVANSVSVINLGELADTDGTAAVVVKDVDVTGGAWCNGYNNSIAISAPPLANLTHTVAPPTGFSNAVNYSLSASYGSFDSSTTPTTIPMASPFAYSASLTGHVTTKKTGDLLVAGTYQAVVTVTLTPGA